MTTATKAHGLVDRLAATIQARVLSGESRPARASARRRSRREFGVSRTPVREALRKLQSNGLVSVEPNRGAVVNGPSVRDIREAYAVRAELEGFAAQQAVRGFATSSSNSLREAEQLFRHSVEGVIDERRRAASSATGRRRASGNAQTTSSTR